MTIETSIPCGPPQVERIPKGRRSGEPVWIILATTTNEPIQPDIAFRGFVLLILINNVWTSLSKICTCFKKYLFTWFFYNELPRSFDERGWIQSICEILLVLNFRPTILFLSVVRNILFRNSLYLWEKKNKKKKFLRIISSFLNCCDRNYDHAGDTIKEACFKNTFEEILFFSQRLILHNTLLRGKSHAQERKKKELYSEFIDKNFSSKFSSSLQYSSSSGSDELDFVSRTGSFATYLFARFYTRACDASSPLKHSRSRRCLRKRA